MTNQTIDPEIGFNQSLLLRVEEAAILLRLGRTQTYELVMLGKIPSVKIGRRRLVVRDGLKVYIATLLREQMEN